jgi:hypothetical protein
MLYMSRGSGLNLAISSVPALGTQWMLSNVLPFFWAALLASVVLALFIWIISRVGITKGSKELYNERRSARRQRLN